MDDFIYTEKPGTKDSPMREALRILSRPISTGIKWPKRDLEKEAEEDRYQKEIEL